MLVGISISVREEDSCTLYISVKLTLYRSGSSASSYHSPLHHRGTSGELFLQSGRIQVTGVYQY